MAARFFSNSARASSTSEANAERDAQAVHASRSQRSVLMRGLLKIFFPQRGATGLEIPPPRFATRGIVIGSLPPIAVSPKSACTAAAWLTSRPAPAQGQVGGLGRSRTRLGLPNETAT